MQKSEWTHTMFLLAAMVIVDGKIFKEEVDAFVSEAVTLNSLVKSDNSFTAKTAFDWFVLNRDDIRAWRKSPDFEKTLFKHLKALKKLQHRKQVLSSMCIIAVADDILHSTENKILSMTAQEWELVLPNAVA